MSSQIAPMQSSATTPMPAGLSTRSSSSAISTFSDGIQENWVKSAAVCFSILLMVSLIFVPLGILIANSSTNPNCNDNPEHNATKAFTENESDSNLNEAEGSIRGAYLHHVNDTII